MFSDDADRLGQLLEEGLLDVREALERGELDHGQHLVLEEHREDDQVDRRSFAEARADADVVVRRLRDEDRLLLESGLADEGLADLELVRDVLALLVAVAWRSGGARSRLPLRRATPS